MYRETLFKTLACAQTDADPWGRTEGGDDDDGGLRNCFLVYREMQA